MYAIKAIAGLRHGEAAGLRWRHYDPDLEPLGRLLVATSYDTGRTKTDVTRRVPVHPTLAKILAAWKLSHWERLRPCARSR
jgi:integrase